MLNRSRCLAQSVWLSARAGAIGLAQGILSIAVRNCRDSLGQGRGWGRLVKFIDMNDMNPQDDAYSPDGSRSDPNEPVFDFPADGDTSAEHNEPHDDGPYHGISFDDSTLGTLSMHDEFSGLTSDGAVSAADDQDDQGGQDNQDGVGADASQHDEMPAAATAQDSAAQDPVASVPQPDASTQPDETAYFAAAQPDGVAQTDKTAQTDESVKTDEPALADETADKPSFAMPSNPMHVGNPFGSAFDFAKHDDSSKGDNNNATHDSAYAKARAKRKDSKSNASSKRVAIMRGVITPLFGVIAVISLIFGILNSTLWKPQHDISASTTQVSTQYLATIPGVLQLVDDSVTVDVKAEDPSTELCMEVSNQNDVSSWLDGAVYTQVSGMESWSALQTQQAKTGEADTAEGADSLSFKDSDLWTQATCDTGEISVDSLTYNPQDALIVVSDPENPGMSDSAVKPYTLTLRWHRDSAPNYAMPFYAVALLFALLAVLAATVFSREHAGRRVAGEDEVPLWEQTAVMMRLRHKSFTSHRGDAQSAASADEGNHTVSSVDVNDGQGVEIKDELGEITASYSVQDFRDYFNQLQNENPDLSASSVLEDVVATTGSMPAITNEKFRPEPRHADTSVDTETPQSSAKGSGVDDETVDDGTVDDDAVGDAGTDGDSTADSAAEATAASMNSDQTEDVSTDEQSTEESTSEESQTEQTQTTEQTGDEEGAQL